MFDNLSAEYHIRSYMWGRCQRSGKQDLYKVNVATTRLRKVTWESTDVALFCPP